MFSNCNIGYCSCQLQTDECVLIMNSSNCASMQLCTCVITWFICLCMSFGHCGHCSLIRACACAAKTWRLRGTKACAIYTGYSQKQLRAQHSTENVRAIPKLSVGCTSRPGRMHKQSTRRSRPRARVDWPRRQNVRIC